MCRYLALCIAALVAACGSGDHFRECEENADCVQASVPGTCRPSPLSDKNWCSFSDTSCPAPPAERWGVLAGDGLAEVCVTQEGGADAGVVDGGEPIDGGDTPDGMGPPDANTQYAKRFGGPQLDGVADLHTDETDSVYLTGAYHPGMDFGAGPLPFAGGDDFYVAKLSDTASHIFSFGFGGSLGDSGAALAVDAAHDVFVTGGFQGTVDFGTGPLMSAGSSDIVLAKLDPTGATVWSKRFGSTGLDLGLAIGVDDAGDVVVAGYFTGSVTFGGSVLTSSGGVDIFVAKLAGSDGAHIWSKNFGGAGTDSVADLVVDAGGSITLTGYFNGSINFGGAALNSAGMSDIFVAKLSGTNGNHLWSRRTGGTDTDYGGPVAVDTAGDVYATGQFGATVDLGGGSVTSAGGRDVFIAKYRSTDGAHQWSHSFGGTDYDIPGDVAVRNGVVAVAGSFLFTADFGGGSLTSAGDSDVFVARYSAADGSHLSSRRFGGAMSDVARGIQIGEAGLLVVSGDFNGIVDFGPAVLAADGSDVFLIRIAP